MTVVVVIFMVIIVRFIAEHWFFYQTTQANVFSYTWTHILAFFGHAYTTLCRVIL